MSHLPDVAHSASNSRQPVPSPQNWQLPPELPVEIRDELVALQVDLYAGHLDQLYEVFRDVLKHDVGAVLNTFKRLLMDIAVLHLQRCEMIQSENKFHRSSFVLGSRTSGELVDRADMPRERNCELQEHNCMLRNEVLQLQDRPDSIELQLPPETPAEEGQRYKVEQMATIHLDPCFALTVTQELDPAQLLLNTTWGNERDMSRSVTEYLCTWLPMGGASVFNTSNSGLLSGLAPNICICLPGLLSPDSAFIYGIIELKQPGETLDIGSSLGRLAQYLLRISRAQLDRKHFWGFLSNLSSNLLLTLTQDQSSGARLPQFQRYPNLTFLETLQYIRAATDAGAPPSTIPVGLPFSPTLGPLHRKLATTRKWMVGEFKNPIAVLGDSSNPTMVVKASLPRGIGHRATPDHVVELGHLRRFLRVRVAPPPSIEKLVWDPLGEEDDGGEGMYTDRSLPLGVEFGVTPVGIPIILNDFTTPSQFSSCLVSILDGLEWLHTAAKTVHRDLRPDNVIFNPATQSAVIIDFDCAWSLPPDFPGDFGEVQTTYGGAGVSIPRRVLENVKEILRTVGDIEVSGATDAGVNILISIQYAPHPTDDLCAFVLLVLALLYPAQFVSFRHCRFLDRNHEGVFQGLERLLESVRISANWGKWWAMAEAGDRVGLRGIRDVALWPFVEKY
ncbi:hypothetical protein BGX38DRAFT_1274346 [Terfezia claveryi]|nr:hypothetical protein BGX38DRAFT_1274346 [Terfezia claveryi]